MPMFADLLKRLVADETDAESFRLLTEKYPGLVTEVDQAVEQAGLRQAEFSRKMNDFQKAEEELASWRAWRQNNWVDDKKMTKTEADLTEKLAATAAALEQFKSQNGTGGTDMTFDEIKNQLAGEGYVKKGDLATLGVATKDDVTSTMNQTLGGMEAVYRYTAPLLIKHSKSFDEVMDMDEFFTFLQTSSLPVNTKDQVNAAYDQWVSPKSAAIRDAEQAKAIEQAKEAGRAEERARLAATGHVPTDTGAGTPASELGTLQQRMRDEAAAKSQTGDPLPGAKLGQVAAVAAELYERGQLTGVSPAAAAQ